MSSRDRGLRAAFLPVAVVALSLALGARAHAAVSAVRITAVSPEPAAVLRPRQSLYVRVEYESDEPIRLQAHAWVDGRLVPSMMNPSPAYPAGKGEAIAWVALEDGQRLDQIRVQIYDGRWRPLVETTETLSARWSASAGESTPAPWVKSLNDFQQHGVGVSMTEGAGPLGTLVSGLIVSGVFALAFGYPVLQILALVRACGAWRTVAALPVFVMIPTYALCLYALSAGSNLWPIWALFLSPPASLVAGFALLMGGRTKVTRVE
jgi:hypothetical protein